MTMRCDKEVNKKAVLSQRWPRNAPYIWVPWKLWAQPWLLSQNFMGFCSDGTVWKCWWVPI